MAISCEDKLSADIIKDCNNKPIGGLEVNAVFINFDDIDKENSTLDANELVITDLATFSTKSGFLLEGIKQTNGASFELVKKEDVDSNYSRLIAWIDKKNYVIWRIDYYGEKDSSLCMKKLIQSDLEMVTTVPTPMKMNMKNKLKKQHKLAEWLKRNTDNVVVNSMELT